MDLRKVKLEGMTKTQLDSLIKKAETQKKQIRRGRKPAEKSVNANTPGIKRIADSINKVAVKEGVSKQEVLEAVAKRMRLRMTAKRGAAKTGGTRAKVAPKYQHPKDPSLTWTGRGKRPVWLREELENGAKLESFLIS